MRVLLALAGGASALLMACSASPTLPEARCRAAGGAAVLGQTLDDRTKELARVGAGAARVDVVPWRMPQPQRDVDPQRLDIEVDGNRTIQRLHCG